ncbi:MAG: hypothetical protein WCE21_04040, partial [Candidatus Babeliales bacterium]
DEYVCALAAHEDKIYTGNGNGVVQLFDIQKEATGIVCALSGTILEILCKNALYIAYENNNIALVDKKSGAIQKIFNGKNPNEQILNILIDPAQEYLYAYGNSGSVDCWDLRMGKKINVAQSTDLDGELLAWVVGTPAVQYLYTVENALIKRNNTDITSLGQKKINCAAYHNNALFTGADNSTITMHDFKTGEPVAQLQDTTVAPSAILNLAYDHEYNRLYAAHLDGTIVEWKAQE